MHKKITHLDSTKKDFKPITDRYYYNKELILEVIDSCFSPDMVDDININGIYYYINNIIVYPELLIQDISLEKYKC